MRHGDERREGALDGIVRVVAELMSGGRVSRTTVAESRRVSLPTADRWLSLLERRMPGLRGFKMGKTVWWELIPSPDLPLTCKPKKAPLSSGEQTSPIATQKGAA